MLAERSMLWMEDTLEDRYNKDSSGSEGRVMVLYESSYLIPRYVNIKADTNTRLLFMIHGSSIRLSED